MGFRSSQRRGKGWAEGEVRWRGSDGGPPRLLLAIGLPCVAPVKGHICVSWLDVRLARRVNLFVRFPRRWTAAGRRPTFCASFSPKMQNESGSRRRCGRKRPGPSGFSYRWWRAEVVVVRTGEFDYVRTAVTAILEMGSRHECQSERAAHAKVRVTHGRSGSPVGPRGAGGRKAFAVAVRVGHRRLDPKSFRPRRERSPTRRQRTLENRPTFDHGSTR